jgi:OTU domain-containing protein 6
MAADHIRKNAQEFAPFLGLDPEEDEFRSYCSKVASDSLAEWGGQLEIRALTECLQREVRVYSANAPLLTMGDSNGLPPLRLAFHRHYYALGEHYNSVTTTDTCCS